MIELILLHKEYKLDVISLSLRLKERGKDGQ